MKSEVLDELIHFWGGAKRIVPFWGAKWNATIGRGTFLGEPLEQSGSVGEGPEERAEKIAMFFDGGCLGHFIKGDFNLKNNQRTIIISIKLSPPQSSDCFLVLLLAPPSFCHCFKNKLGQV